MADDVEIKLYLDHVQVVVEQATDEALKRLAYTIVKEAQDKIVENDQIDTGFMVNSIYPVWKDGSGFEAAKSAAESKATNRRGKTVDHSGDMAPEAQLPEDATAGVVVGASYAIYQEADRPFLYPAAEKAAAEFGGEAEKIFREVLPDEGPGDGP